jgi:hypothetical protein
MKSTSRIQGNPIQRIERGFLKGNYLITHLVVNPIQRIESLAYFAFPLLNAYHKFRIQYKVESVYADNIISPVKVYYAYSVLRE